MQPALQVVNPRAKKFARFEPGELSVEPVELLARSVVVIAVVVVIRVGFDCTGDDSGRIAVVTVLGDDLTISSSPCEVQL
jgi:hypothetical protein